MFFTNLWKTWHALTVFAGRICHGYVTTLQLLTILLGISSMAISSKNTLHFLRTAWHAAFSVSHTAVVGRYKNVVITFCWRHLAASSIFCRNCIYIVGDCSIWSECLDASSSKTYSLVDMNKKWSRSCRNNEEVHSHSVPALCCLGNVVWHPFIRMVSIYLLLDYSKLYKLSLYNLCMVFVDRSMDLCSRRFIYVSWSIYVYRYV